MTPQERQQVAELFDRLATLESARRDPDAERLIAEETRRAPNAAYALVQTVLVQDEALRAAHERLREYEGEAPQQGGFLDNMRDSIFGRRGSVPSVRPGEQGGAWQRGAPEQQQGGGGSFLGTAAASAAGVIGGALLLNSFRGMFGGGQQQGMLDQGGGRSPWGGNESANSDLARDAGVNDIGRGGRQADAESGNRQGLFDTAEADTDDNSDYGDDSDFDGGDSDLA